MSDLDHQIIPSGHAWDYLGFMNGGWKPTPACKALDSEGVFE
jgi:hypothetical protein